MMAERGAARVRAAQQTVIEEARLAYKQGRFAEAIAGFTQVAASVPLDPVSEKMLAVARRKLGP